ncbi:MAG: right-handed parallel beta-helix repeat-containing protein, partial [Anaerolineales bacterium]
PRPSPNAIKLRDEVTTNITSNVTWTLANSPYTLTANIIVSPNVTLTIEPGVIVRGQSGTELQIQGHLAAIGTPTQTITFTSKTDTGANQWAGLKFISGTGELHHTVLRYAGQGTGINQGILIQSSPGVTVHSSAVLSNADNGVTIQDSRVVFSDTRFTRHQTTNRNVIEATGANTITVISSTFENNSNSSKCVLDAQGIVTVQRTTFRNNDGPGLCLGADNWTLASALTFISDTALIRAGTISRSMRLPTAWGAEFYELAGEVAVGSGIPLTIEPGIELRGQSDASLLIQGHLTARGTPTRPITFTSTEPGIQKWRGIRFDGGSGDLTYVTVRNAGAGITSKGGIELNNQANLTLQYSRIISNGNDTYNTAGVWVRDSRATISRTLFAHNGILTDSTNYANYALYATGDAIVTLTNSILKDTTGTALGAMESIEREEPHMIARHNRIFDNFKQADADVELDARYNWWGAEPPTATLFSGSIITAPWIITETFTSGYFDLARDAHEPNAAFDQATPLGEINTGVVAFLDPAGDVDLYEVNVPESGNLVAVVDATGTPLAPEVTIYNSVQATMTTVSDGAHVTATAAADPGASYYIRVRGDGGLAQTSSHQPYRLTVLLADPNEDLIAQAQRHGGRTYPLGSRSIALTPGAATQVTTETTDISLAGGYYLLSELRNAQGQIIATARAPFFLSDSPLALTLNTDAPAYRPGETITITGKVHNTGDTDIDQTLTLEKDDAPIHTERIILGPDESTSYQTTTTAPQIGDVVTLTGEISSARVVARFDIVTPTVAATLDAPPQTLPHPFVAQTTLANNTAVPADLHVDFHGARFTPTVAPGALTILTRALQLTQTTHLSLSLTGDFTDTLTQTVAVSAAPTLTLRADDPQREGDVVLPYALENPGAVDLVAEVIFDLADAVPFRRSTQPAPQLFGSDRPAARAQGIAWLTPHALDANGAQIRRTYLLPAGDRLDDTLIVSLTRGLRPLTMTLQLNPSDNPGLFDHSQGNLWQRARGRTLTVQGENDLKLTASGAPTVTAVITNVGWNAISGTLVAQGQRAGQPFAREVRALHLDKDARIDLTLPLDALHLAAGPYTVAVALRSEDGALLAQRELPGSIAPPDLALTHIPATTIFPAGETTPLTYTVHNRGGAPELVDFHLAWDALLDQSRRRWL